MKADTIFAREAVAPFLPSKGKTRITIYIDDAVLANSGRAPTKPDRVPNHDERGAQELP